MGKVSFVAAEDARYESARAVVARSPEGSSERELPEGSRDTQENRIYFTGSAEAMSLMEVKAGPDKPTVPHAHEVDEIVYVLEGSLEVGNRSYGPECAIYVPANTLYAFRVGPQGVRYLNIRPREDHSYLVKDQFMAKRRDAVETKAPPGKAVHAPEENGAAS